MAIGVAARDGGLWIRLDRPERRNALTAEMFGALTEAFRRAAGSADYSYVVVSASGPDFCAGAT